MNALEKLRSVVDELKAGPEGGLPPLKIQPTWDLAGRLAGRFPVDADRLKRAMLAKDLTELDAIVSELESPSKPEPSGAGGSIDTGTLDKATLDAAMRAFRKRLKLQRLADESRLGGRYTSGGRTSNIDAIIPPDDFGPEVWAALAAEGRLKDTGNGFYAAV